MIDCGQSFPILRCCRHRHRHRLDQWGEVQEEIVEVSLAYFDGFRPTGLCYVAQHLVVSASWRGWSGVFSSSEDEQTVPGRRSPNLSVKGQKFIKVAI